jgi:hypothetical protein
MYSQPRFGLVTPEMVRGALKATGSTDRDVLAAAIDQFAAPYRPLKWFGIWAIVTGVLCCLLIIMAFIGIPLLVFGYWALKRSKKNATLIAAEYEVFLAGTAARGNAPGAGAGGASGLAAMGIVLALVAGTGGVASAQNEEVYPEWRGDYVAATAACSAPVKLRLGTDRMTLVNGRDSAVFRDLDFSHSYWGNSYEGIQFVSMPEYTRSVEDPKGPPFLVIFNAEEKQGMLQVTDLQPALKRRFPVGDARLKRCGGSATLGAAAPPRQAPGCTGAARCDEGTTFAATITDVRTSVSGRDRLVAVTLRVRNRMSQPLTLGYVQNSGVITDDRGNRYVMYGPGALRGMGEISGRNVDPKFTLAAGEEADARLEFGWRPTGGAIYGTSYDLAVALREIEPLPADQWQLGREHALQYRGLTPSGAQAAAAAPVRPAGPPSDGAAEPTASCDGRPRCTASGPFTADVVNLVPSVSGRHHVIQVTLKVTNAGTAPLYLGYHSGSSGAVDDLGNRYYYGRASTHDTSFRGIGLVTGRAADPQFRVDPGSSRTATFSVIRFEGARQQQGTSWTWDLALDELEILPSRQVRVARQHALSFPDLAKGGAATASVDDAARGLVEGVKSLFGGKKD